MTDEETDMVVTESTLLIKSINAILETSDYYGIAEVLRHFDGWAPLPDDYLCDGFREGERVVVATHNNMRNALFLNENSDGVYLGQISDDEKKRIIEAWERELSN